MITTATTFVIGAGASEPYGLPIANELRRRADVDMVPRGDAYQLLLQSGIDVVELNAFVSDLREHPAESIDAFLESRQHVPRTLEIGRAVIAALMAVAIRISRQGKQTSNRDTDWLRYVVEKMRRGAPTWEAFADGNARVRFVTFNFDTLIEEHLERAVRAIYRGSAVNFGQVLERIRVVHVHGKLPEVPTAEFVWNSAFGHTAAWTTWMQMAPKAINVVLDEIPDSTRDAAAKAVSQARILCFLGFGYDPENLKRIDMPAVFSSPHFHCEIYGTAFHLLAGEKMGISRRFHNHITLGDFNQGCCEALRALDVFRE